MVSPDMIRNVVGIVGNVISFGLFLSPVPTFWRIIKNKNVQDFKQTRTIMYSSPLTIMSQVVKTKSVEYMPLLLSVVSFLNGLCWTSYALIRFDIFITIPNGLGVLFAAVQLILYIIYYRTTPKKQDKNLELPTVTPVAMDTSVAPISEDDDVNGSTASHVSIDITIQP
uniref:Bidirectional sugar transporter SWEET n=1 Tax=Oryza meridionalis TaxID=40149 RepID=A0A0E0EFS9_9ORYZ